MSSAVEPDGPAVRFSLPDVAQRLKAFGFVFDRQAAGSHEIWFNPASQRYSTLINHPGDFPEGTLRAILRQAGIEPDDVLSR